MTLPAGSEFATLLETVPTRAMRRRLVRCVAALDFLEGSPPTYLYTSGRPGRCNPRDVDCLYFSETEPVAELESRRRFAGVGAATEPRLTFFAQVDLKHVVDLSKPAVLKMLGLSTDDLFEAWRTVPTPTRLQRLGLAVSTQRRVSAIRFFVELVVAILRADRRHQGTFNGRRLEPDPTAGEVPSVAVGP